MVGNARRIRDELGWVPKYSFDETLSVVLNDCRARLS
jgi:hypothetical protein